MTRDRSDWQGKTGESWAAMYRETDRSFSTLTQHLLERISELPGETIVDIGCGAGELSLAVARARPRSNVTGVDVSADLVAAAQARAQHHPNLTYQVADAASWASGAAPVDLIISRHGVMFFDDPPAAFAHLKAQARQGAPLLFSCFRSPRENAWMSDIGAMVAGEGGGESPDPHAPGPFAFADPQHVERILSTAGWSHIDFEPYDFAYIAGYGDDPVKDAAGFFSRIGPAAAAMRELGEAEHADLMVRVRGWLDSHRDGNLVAFPAAAWIVSARNA